MTIVLGIKIPGPITWLVGLIEPMAPPDPVGLRVVQSNHTLPSGPAVIW